MENENPEGSSQYHAFTTDAGHWKKLKGFARANRHAPTEAENLLWQELRSNKLGVRFRRQHAIAQYIVDFCCLSAWLIIEVDGGYHQEAGQVEYDGGRSHDLQEAGFTVLRFSNDDVKQSLYLVVRTIACHLNNISLKASNRQAPPLPKERGPGGEVTP